MKNIFLILFLVVATSCSTRMYTVNNAPIYAQPTATAATLGTVPNYTPVKAKQKQVIDRNVWYYVTLPQQKGFIEGKNLVVSENLNSANTFTPAR